MIGFVRTTAAALAAAMRPCRRVLPGLLFGLCLVALARPAQATNIERVVTPRGIEVWLVNEPSVPLIALEFAFRGGASQDPADKPGLAGMTAALLDEGAGDLDANTFHERLEAKAIEFSASAYRDTLTGSVRTLTENRDEAFGLLKLALTAPRFDNEAVERIRADILAVIRRDTTNPNELAGRKWWATAFPAHPYGHSPRGTTAGVEKISADDLKAYVGHVFARDNLKIAVVGNIDAATTARLVDDVFGGLPAKAELGPVPAAAPADLGASVDVKIDMPQSTLLFGGVGIPRLDPDFMAAYVVNHILGGGSFSSRLYREVREERGLAYSVYSSLIPLQSTALFFVATATRSDRVEQTRQVIEEQIRRMAEEGPTAEELAQAKSYLKGSYALSFDTSPKIANQLVLIQVENLGIDYINRRNAMVDAVTLDDARRVAKRLLGGKLLATIAGRPQEAAATPPTAVSSAPVRAQ